MIDCAEGWILEEHKCIHCFGTVNVQFTQIKRNVFYIHVDVSFSYTFHVQKQNSSLRISDLSKHQIALIFTVPVMHHSCKMSTLVVYQCTENF